MKWQSHLSNVCKIVSKSLFLLSQLKYYVNVKARKLVYSAHILSYTNYASTLWDVCSEVHLKKTTTHNLNSLHRRATKLILSDPSIPTDNKLKSIKLLPLTKQLKYNKAVVMFKVYNGKTPEYIRSLFTRSSSRYGSNNFIPPRPRIDLYKPVSHSRDHQSGTLFRSPSKTCEPSDASKGTCIDIYLNSQPCQLYIILPSWFHNKRLLSPFYF